jgi:hypothetical protein
MVNGKKQAVSSKQQAGEEKANLDLGSMATFSILPFQLFSSSPVHLRNSVFVNGY